MNIDFAWRDAISSVCPAHPLLFVGATELMQPAVFASYTAMHSGCAVNEVNADISSLSSDVQILLTGAAESVMPVLVRLVTLP